MEYLSFPQCAKSPTYTQSMHFGAVRTGLRVKVLRGDQAHRLGVVRAIDQNGMITVAIDRAFTRGRDIVVFLVAGDLEAEPGSEEGSGDPAA